MDYSNHSPSSPLRKTLSALCLLLFVVFASPTLVGCSADTSKVCSGGDCKCLPGESCTMTCPDGRCNIDCPTDATCDISCAGGDCDIACQDGASCDIDCSGGGCTIGCTSADRCESTCTEGCGLTCVATSQCSQDCDGADCSCVGCDGLSF